MRDRHAAAALGRPYRIRDEDCDIEPLLELDFRVDNGYSLDLCGVQEDFHASYMIEMSKLAVIRMYFIPLAIRHPSLPIKLRKLVKF
jgi:hypothetical protein